MRLYARAFAHRIARFSFSLLQFATARHGYLSADSVTPLLKRQAAAKKGPDLAFILDQIQTEGVVRFRQVDWSACSCAAPASFQ
ncbi:hypothetical protein D9600_06580 [Deinococcus sp. DB0503]|nr:hypothetical protein [Deinococcus sp. DB0503]